MAATEPETSVAERYDRSAERYFDHVGAELEHASLDRAGLQLFAELVGPGAETIDAGCGPGHIAAFLASHGLNVSGIDISPALIEIARTSFPDIDFRVGELAHLPVNDSSVQAVVSRHSVIHTKPDRLDEVFAEFGRVLTADGRLFLSFFATDDPGEHGQPFDHAVCTAYQLDPNVISELLACAGIDEEMRLLRRPHPGARPIPHATLIAQRDGDGAHRP